MTAAPPTTPFRRASALTTKASPTRNLAYGRGPATRALFGRYWLAHALLPAIGLALLSYALIARGLDFQVADALYALQGESWRFRSTYLAENLIHILGRNISILAWLTVAVAWGASHRSTKWKAWRWPLLYLMLATLAGVAMSSLVKATSNMDCPWDLVRYGGTREFIGLLQFRPEHLPKGGCFPAGHASAGYAWLSLYFFLGYVSPRYRWHGLALGTFVGLLFGVSQQLRGAHFLSHDVWTAAICWFMALGLQAVMFTKSEMALRLRREPNDGR